MEVPVRISDGRHPAPPRSPRRDHNRLLHRQEVAGPAIGADRFAVPLIGDGLEPRGTVFKIQFVGKQHHRTLQYFRPADLVIVNEAGESLSITSIT